LARATVADQVANEVGQVGRECTDHSAAADVAADAAADGDVFGGQLDERDLSDGDARCSTGARDPVERKVELPSGVGPGAVSMLTVQSPTTGMRIGRGVTVGSAARSSRARTSVRRAGIHRPVAVRTCRARSSPSVVPATLLDASS